MAPVSIVLLAAGGSSRLGRPKQLVKLGNQTLIRLAVGAAAGSGASEIVVVLGAYAEAIEAELSGLGVRMVFNEHWPEGIGSSIAKGVSAVDAGSEAALAMLSDQPTIDSKHLSALIGLWREQNPEIVASSYEGKLGVPCLFSRGLFSSLQDLSGDVGAKNLIRNHPGRVASVLCRSGQIDVDTIADMQRLGAK